ncbi:LysR family transcriptional regulator [Pseudarthrobacter raffinosi]|uniref:LysR family transcriptional regulator n=1 Tax=Pseudarthrobacter raffinosi TaxID=2953651 RepID=UPI00208E3203|nr:LysR family transcriptional regulator [Pseudarthrobacter sp. MDT3-9]MCO4253247.1 LysR family transcriptional regulator [Pseudarthrobacter sp. MDT3-9]
MTLTQLQAFLAAVRHGSFSAAARELDISQPAISDLVRRLEAELGASLFMRGARRLLLTAAGDELLPFAEQSVVAAEGGAQAVKSLTTLEGGTATFGLLRNADYYLLSNLAKEFHAKHPKVKIRLVGLNSAETAEAVLAGDLEAGLIVLPVVLNGLKAIPLVRDEIVHVTNDKEVLQAGPTTIESFAQRPLILYDAHYAQRDPTRRQVTERAETAGLTLTPQIEVEQVESALALVSDGIGDTFTCRAVAASPTFPKDLGVVPFDPPLYDTIALVKKEGHTLSAATGELAKLARMTLLSMAQSGNGTWQPVERSKG